MSITTQNIDYRPKSEVVKIQREATNDGNMVGLHVTMEELKALIFDQVTKLLRLMKRIVGRVKDITRDTNHHDADNNYRTRALVIGSGEARQ